MANSVTIDLDKLLNIIHELKISTKPDSSSRYHNLVDFYKKCKSAQLNQGEITAEEFVNHLVDFGCNSSKPSEIKATANWIKKVIKTKGRWMY